MKQSSIFKHIYLVCGNTMSVSTCHVDLIILLYNLLLRSIFAKTMLKPRKMHVSVWSVISGLTIVILWKKSRNSLSSTTLYKVWPAYSVYTRCSVGLNWQGFLITICLIIPWATHLEMRVIYEDYHASYYTQCTNHCNQFYAVCNISTYLPK